MPHADSPRRRGDRDPTSVWSMRCSTGSCTTSGRRESGRADFRARVAQFDEQYSWDGHDGLKMQATTPPSCGTRRSRSAGPRLVAEHATLVTRSRRLALELRALPARQPDPRRRGRGRKRHYHTVPRRLAFQHRAVTAGPLTQLPRAWVAVALAPGISTQLLSAPVDLPLSWQNEDGGWPPTVPQRSGTWLEAINSQCSATSWS